MADPLFSSVMSFNKSLVRSVRSFKRGVGTVDGTMLMLFCGYTSKRKAVREAAQLDLAEGICADIFEMAFLSDQADKRKGWMTFTRCNFMVDGEHRFHFETHAGLVKTETGTFDERVPFAFAKLLRSQTKYWHIHDLAYSDLKEELDTIKIIGSVGFAPCYNDPIADVLGPKDEADELESAIDKALSSSKPPVRKPTAEVDDPLRIDAAFDPLFGPVDLAADGSDTSDSNDVAPDEAEYESN